MSAVAVRLLAAVSTEVAAVSVSPMASRSEVMLATSVSLPWAADCALEEISRVAASCWPTALAIAVVLVLQTVLLRRRYPGGLLPNPARARG